MNFTIVDNQNGTFIVQAVDAQGNVLTLPSDTACASSNAALLAVGAPLAPGQFPVTAQGVGNDGTVTLTVSSVLANVYTSFTFAITTSDVVVGFTATLVNVTQNPAPVAPVAAPAPVAPVAAPAAS